MPAILSQGYFGAWLDPTESRAEKLLPLLASYAVERMRMWLVRDRVNPVKEDGADLLTKVEPKPTWTQPSLFDDAA
jgi:putative SOS response-associated peptidase YedK